MSVVLVLPLVGDLVGAVVPVSVGLVHDPGVEAADHLGDDPLDVVHDGVGVGVGGDVLVVGRLPEGDHVLPDGAVHNVSTRIQNIFRCEASLLVDVSVHTSVPSSSKILYYLNIDCANKY